MDLENISRFVLLDSNSPGEGDQSGYLFIEPVEALNEIIKSPEEAAVLFKEMELLSRQYYIAGYLPYELGYFLHPKTHSLIPPSGTRPFIGAYKDVIRLDSKMKFLFSNPKKNKAEYDFSIDNMEMEMNQEEFIYSVEKIKKHIEEGDTYQVNFTTRLNFDFNGNPLTLYATLRRSQPTQFSALIRNNNEWILSLSPELFFKIENGTITSKPMKGTMPRGRTNDEDAEISSALHYDEKNRAENLMIVDLIRNDIGRISETGSVNVSALFEVEKYKTVFQMTSTVKGELKPGLSLTDIFRSMFPCGSVTGAPKLRTMEIIRELEKSPRNIYTGAIGFIPPGSLNGACFNVAIRTVEINDSKGRMGTGSGIVWDSNPEKEYEESLLKAQFLTVRHDPLHLIESLRYENKYFRLDAHKKRLLGSARYFNIFVSKENVLETLENEAKHLTRNIAYKVKLTVSEEGEISATHETIEPIDMPVHVTLSPISLSPSDRYLYHKTSRRRFYDVAHAGAVSKGFFDVIFFNEKNEITEGAISNVYIERDGMLITPPVRCGLLKGIYREELIAKGKAKEDVITVDEFTKAEKRFVSNSVRGLIEIIGSRFLVAGFKY